MALGSTRPLTEMSTRNICWGGKFGRCVGVTTLPPSCANCLEIWERQPPGILRACARLQWDCFTFYCAEYCKGMNIQWYHSLMLTVATVQVEQQHFL